jgi:DNA-directed RNA polymerase subunit RPC12/RpoP
MVKKDLAQNYRSLTSAHLKRAQAGMSGSDEDLSSVCLELRRCIEALAYGLLATYRQELSTSAMMSWTPKRVLQELEAADPTANSSRSISIEFPGASGESGSTFVISGEDRRFSPKWANKAYNKLSSILHVPTPKMLEDGTILSAEKIRAQCKEYVDLFEEILSGKIWHFMSGQFVDHTCDCGFMIKRRLESISKNTVFECSECGRKYDVTSIDDKRAEITLRVAQWKCHSCGSDNEFGAHELVENKEIKCPSCGSIARIERVWAFTQCSATSSE